MAYVEILQGPDGSRNIILGEEVFLGRSRTNAVSLPDQHISRQHALIRHQGTSFVIEDLNSTNGVILQGVQLTPGTPYELHDGDEIQICSICLVFHSDQPSPSRQSTDRSDGPDAEVTAPPPRHAPLQSGFAPLSLTVLPDDVPQPQVAMALDASASMLEVGDNEKQTDKGLQDALKRLQAICQVSTALITIVDRDRLLQCVLDDIFSIFPSADRSFIVLREKDSNTLIPVAAKQRQEMPDHQSEVAISRTVINEVVTHKRSILSYDAADDERFGKHASVLSLSIRSMMCAPLLVQGEILGLIQVDTHTASQVFTREDLHILTGIAAQVALAVKNSQINELENHLQVMTTINRIGVALSAEKDTGRLLEMILDGARSITNADGGALYLVTEDGQLKLSTMRIDSLDLTLDSSAEAPIPLYDHTGDPNISMVAAYSVLNGATINIPDIYTAEGFDLSGNYRFDQERGYRSQSFLSVPMKNHQHGIIGVLQLINTRDQFSQEIVPFSEEDQRLAESLASQAAVGLTRNKLIEALEESEKRYRDLVENCPGAICIHDLDGTLTFVNQAWARPLGYQPADLIGRNLSDLLASSVQHLLGHYLAHVRQELTAEGLARLTAKNGAECIWSYRSLLYEEAGKPPYVFTHAQDITERKHLEAHLRQVQKMEAIGTLASGIAHDFNNILSAILGYTEITMEDTPKDSHNWENLQRVLIAGKRAKDLVQQILAFSRRSEAGRRPVELYLIVQEELKLLRASLPTSIEIRHHIDETSGAVLADPTQMHQVMMNLCTNAGHAMRKTGGLLEVHLQNVDVSADLATAHLGLTSGPYVCLTVKDTGHGMTPEVMKRIFEPFYTTKDLGEGTGMGLAMIHGIIANHGGAITVESQPEQGTTFEVYLPRIVEARSSEANSAERVPKDIHRKKCVLLVDDEEPLAHLGQMMIERCGYEAVSITSCLEALETFRKSPHRFDLVITDQTMPHMSGDELTKELRAIRPDIPIILYTGFSHTMTEEKARELGIDAFLMKPLIPSDLQETMRKVLEQKEHVTVG